MVFIGNVPREMTELVFIGNLSKIFLTEVDFSISYGIIIGRQLLYLTAYVATASPLARQPAVMTIIPDLYCPRE